MDQAIISTILAICASLFGLWKTYQSIDAAFVNAVTKGHDKVTRMAYHARIAVTAIHLREYVKQDLLDGKLDMLDALDSFLITHVKK